MYRVHFVWSSLKEMLREIWREKIEGAKTIRRFDLENNKVRPLVLIPA